MSETTPSIEESLRSGAVRGGWEFFRDESYFGMWCVREVGSRGLIDGFHVSSQEEASALHSLLEELREKVRQSALDYLALDGQATEALDRALAAEAKCDDTQEQAESFKAMYRQACDWRDAKIANIEAEVVRLKARIADLEERHYAD